MLKKLKRKFILINMLLVGVVIVLGCAAFDIFQYGNLKSEMLTALEDAIASSSSQQHRPGEQRTEIGARGNPASSRIPVYTVLYSVSADSFSSLSEATYIDTVTLEGAVKFAVASAEKAGEIPDCGLSYLKIVGEDEIRVAFTDSAYASDAVKTMAAVEAAVFAAFMLILYFISLILAKVAIKPIDDTWKLQKQFITDASHELKTPLTVILANNGIIRSHGNESVESQKQWLDSTEEEARRMKALVDDMLSLARNESADTRLAKSEVDFSKTVRGVFLQFEAVAFEKKITISCDAEDGVRVSGDENKLKQLLMTLTDNAIKYEPAGGEVSITLQKKNGGAVLSVKNRDSFIAEKDIAHIFDRFYRSDASRSSEGFGLGLAIAKSIAALHGGSISVSSDGGGTVFTVVLPCC